MYISLLNDSSRKQEALESLRGILKILKIPLMVFSSKFFDWSVILSSPKHLTIDFLLRWHKSNKKASYLSILYKKYKIIYWLSCDDVVDVRRYPSSMARASHPRNCYQPLIVFSDIDECDRWPCGNGYCTNLVGSFSCTCYSNYREYNNQCIGTIIKLCILYAMICHVNIYWIITQRLFKEVFVKLK